MVEHFVSAGEVFAQILLASDGLLPGLLLVLGVLPSTTGMTYIS